jgi:flavodoxin
MKALIIYESMFGSTQAIASAIGEGISSQSCSVDVVEVGTAPTSIDSEVDLLVVGGPTHQFGLSRRSSREMAAKDAKAPLVSGRIGVREWIEDLKLDRPGLAIAAFDTSLTRPRFLRYFGRASRKIQKRLERRNCKAVAEAESFWVAGSTGPLEDGEESRARAWGEQLGSEVGAPFLTQDVVK